MKRNSQRNGHCFAKRLTALLFLLLIVSVPAALAQQADAERFSDLVKSATKHLDAGAYDLAIRECDEALKIVSTIAEIYALRGTAYSLKGDYEKAIADLSEAVRRKPEIKAPAYAMRGLTFENLKRFDEALKDFTEAIQRDGTNSVYYEARGRNYFKKAQYDTAISDLTESIRLGEKNWRAYVFRGHAYFLKGESTRAITDESEAIKLNPEFVGAYQIRALAYRKLDKIELAEADEKKVKELESKNK